MTMATTGAPAMAMGHNIDDDFFMLATGADLPVPDSPVALTNLAIMLPTAVGGAYGSEGDMIMSPIDTATSPTALPITEGWDGPATIVMTDSTPTPLGVGGAQSLSWPYI